MQYMCQLGCGDADVIIGRYERGWQATRSRIAAAERAAGRKPGVVRLLAVSKTFPAEAIRAVYALGQRAFGENYVRECAAKRAVLGDLPGLEWHLVGALQSNKSGLAAAAFNWVETVDRVSIADRLAAARRTAGSPLDVLVQVNVSGEATKSGVAPSEAPGLAHYVASLPGLRLRGIMGIPASTQDSDALRSQFRELRRCYEACLGAGLAVDTLSMGMSGDLEIAIEEGATEVRVGTAVFGARSA